MKRLIGCLVGCALLALASACGGGSAQPSVAVKEGPLLQTQGHEVYVFLLTPTAKPSGVIALKSVRDGHVQTVDHVRFTAMTGVGSAAVEVAGHSIVAFWTIPSQETASAQRSGSLPPRSTTSGTAWGGLTATPGGTEAEQVFWTQDRYDGKPPNSGSTLCGGSFDTVVRASKETPAKTSYCLTIEVDGQ